MINKLILGTVLVSDLDEALEWYKNNLGFVKKHDLQSGGDRWLTIAPPKQKEIEFVLRKPIASSNELIIRELNLKIGKGALWSLSTNDLDELYTDFQKKGVNFINKPETRINGRTATFEDPWGNRFDVVEVPLDES